MHKPAHRVVIFPASRANIFIKGQHISAALNSFLHLQFTTSAYWEYLETKFGWTPTTRKLIAWQVYHTSLRKQTTKRHQQLIKYMIEWLPTGYIVNRHDSTEDHRCPHCLTVYEKKPHLLRCPHPDRASQRQRFLTVNLHNFYHTSNTAQPVRELISRNLIQWFQNPTLSHRTPRNHPLFRASVHQQAIGW